MATKKFFDCINKDPYPVSFTQPNMSFTPRQIIEQFATGEVIAQTNDPSDDYYDDRYSDDQLANVQFVDDDFLARQKIIDYYEEEQTANKVRKSSGDPKGEKLSDGTSDLQSNEVEADNAQA